MPGENSWIFDGHSSKTAPGISFFRVSTKDDEYSTNWRNNIVAVINRDAVIKTIKKNKLKPNIVSCIILKKKWYAVSKLFLPNCIFHYISNWSKVFELYLTSFSYTNSWRVKFRNFLGNLPVHSAALFINRTIKNYYMTLLL